MTTQEFKVGDNVIVTDHFSSVGTYSYPCYVKEVEPDYYILRKRKFTAINELEERIPKSYPHIKLG